MNKFEVLSGIIALVSILFELIATKYISYISFESFVCLLPICYYTIDYLFNVEKKYDSFIKYKDNIYLLLFFLFVFIAIKFENILNTIENTKILIPLIFIVLSVILDSYILHIHKTYGKEDNPNQTLFIYYFIITIGTGLLLYFIPSISSIGSIGNISKYLIPIVLINILTGYSAHLLRFYNIINTNSIQFSLFRYILPFLNF